MEFTKVFFDNVSSTSRYTINSGGTSSSKSYSILQLLYLKALKHQGLHISCVAESLPVLKRGIIRDFLKMLKEENLYDPNHHNMSDNAYTIGTSKIEFFSVDDSSKARGARRDVLFVNEANNVSYDTFQELEIRTKDKIYIDFNPVASFWVHEKLMLLPKEEFTFIKSTYLDNDKLSPQIIKSIEMKRLLHPEWFKVYGLAELGSLEGIIFSNWELCDEMPTDFQWEMHGVDFGFTNDPSTCIRVCLSEGQLWIDELLYEYGLTNSDLNVRLETIKSKETIADSAEPKSIEELKRYGFRIKGSTKGPDSVRQGINVLKKYKMNVTKRSTNLIKELRNYQWAKTKDGNLLNKPIDGFDHCLDPIRYIMAEKDKRPGKYDYSFEAF